MNLPFVALEGMVLKFPKDRKRNFSYLPQGNVVSPNLLLPLQILELGLPHHLNPCLASLEPLLELLFVVVILTLLFWQCLR